MKLNYKFLIYLLLASLVFYFLCFKIIDISLKRYTLHHEIIYVPSLVGLNLSSTQDTLEKHHLNFIIIDSAAYNPNYERGSVLAHTPKAGSEVKPGRKIYLTVNPTKITYISFPELKNKSLRQAISLLETNAFRVGHLYYIKHFAKDVVRFSKLEDRKLSFNDTLPKFSIIDLYLGDGYSDGVFVPNLKGLELYEVKRKLNNNSLNLGKSYISDSIVDSTKIVIYEQNPKADEKVQIGTFVTVWGRDSVIHIID